MKSFQTLEPCIEAAHDDQESKKPFARFSAFIESELERFGWLKPTGSLS
jgi:hypothetical protein